MKALKMHGPLSIILCTPTVFLILEQYICHRTSKKYPISRKTHKAKKMKMRRRRWWRWSRVFGCSLLFCHAICGAAVVEKEKEREKEKVYRKHKAAKKEKEERQTEPSLLCCYKHNRYGKSRSQSLEEKRRIIGGGGRLLCSTFQNEVSHEGKRSREGGEKYSCAKPIWKGRKGRGDEAIIVQDSFFPSAVIFPNVGERSEFSDESVPPRSKEMWCT